ncbi:MAG: NUDIX hydrolase [Anaerolineales bacterium]|nr:NUDIX hydrolase [Anaerolineales bacterium]
MGKWRLLSSEPLLENQWIGVYQNRYEIRDERIIEDYTIIHRDDFVLVVALDGKKLVLIRQYRPATEKSYLCLPAGFIEPDETPQQAALRELAEETGYRAQRCRLIARLDALPGYLRSAAYIVLCDDIHPGPINDIDLEVDEVLLMDMDAVIEMIVRGEIYELQAVSAILLVNTMRERESWNNY